MPHVIEADGVRPESGGIGKVGMARAWIHAETARRSAPARPGPTSLPGRRLRDVARPGARPAVHEQPVPLQLALVLELGDRRAGQQRHPRRRRRPMGPGRRGSLRAVTSGGGQVTSSTTIGRSPIPRSSPGNSPTPASSGSIGSGRQTPASKGPVSASLSMATRVSLVVDENSWKCPQRRRGRRPGRPMVQAPHIAQFRRVRQGPATAPNADIEVGHLSTRLCQIGNIAHRVGRKLSLRRGDRVVPRGLPRPRTHCSPASTPRDSRCLRRSDRGVTRTCS